MKLGHCPGGLLHWFAKKFVTILKTYVTTRVCVTISKTDFKKY